MITSIYGRYDGLKQPVEQTVECSYVCVTDEDPGPPGVWQVVIEPRAHLHPRMAAKVAKCLPLQYAPDSAITIWIDGSATPIHPEFVEMCLDALGEADMAQWVHPERDCIYAEADASIAYGKYHDQNVAGQAAHYRALGFPAHGGLWATGCIVRRHTRRPYALNEFGMRWLDEQLRWTIQDQLSETPVLATTALGVVPLDEGLWNNRWLAFGGHVG